MAENSNELTYRLLKKSHERFDKVDTSNRDIKSQLVDLRGVVISMQSDIHNI